MLRRGDGLLQQDAWLSRSSLRPDEQQVSEDEAADGPSLALSVRTQGHEDVGILGAIESQRVVLHKVAADHIEARRVNTEQYLGQIAQIAALNRGPHHHRRAACAGGGCAHR
ncbi:hypothetical protein D3C76_1365360 [compost metagenome]